MFYVPSIPNYGTFPVLFACHSCLVAGAANPLFYLKLVQILTLNFFLIIDSQQPIRSPAAIAGGEADDLSDCVVGPRGFHSNLYVTQSGLSLNISMPSLILVGLCIHVDWLLCDTFGGY